jgi:hypothetical protein
VDFLGKTADDGENYFLDSFEKWLKVMKLERFSLLGTKSKLLLKRNLHLGQELIIISSFFFFCQMEGHSFGAYLSATYALRNPQCVERLILCDPWGGIQSVHSHSLKQKKTSIEHLFQSFQC